MPIGPDLLALGRAHMELAHEMILVGAALGVLSVLAGLLSRRLGAPVLLVFLVLGMLAGEDGPGGIQYDDFASAYLVGSVALAVILFEGGLKTHLSMLRLAVWPALALAVIGVGITAAIVAAAVMWIAAVPFAMAMLVGSAVAPTDAAAVAALLGRARLALPERINALLEIESGLNDPMSIFLTVFVIRVIVEPASATWSQRRAAVRARDDRRRRARAGRRLAARPAVAPPVAGSPHRHGAGAGVQPGAVRPRAGPRHQRLPGDLPRRRDRRRDTAPRPARDRRTSSRAPPGWRRSCCS